jgi:frataxin-like iron-binding protein CyaY
MPAIVATAEPNGSLWIAGNNVGMMFDVNQQAHGSWSNATSVSRAGNTNRLIVEYDQQVDEIIAACRGDLRWRR